MVEEKTKTMEVKMFVVKCENGGSPWWLNGCLGDPGRTIVLANAEQYKTKGLAEKAKNKAVKENPFRELENRLKVIAVVGKNFENKIIEVCNKCFCASCWYGESMCDESKYAGTVSRTVSELRSLNNEHASYWSDEKMKEMFGDVAPYGYKKKLIFHQH